MVVRLLQHLVTAGKKGAGTMGGGFNGQIKYLVLADEVDDEYEARDWMEMDFPDEVSEWENGFPQTPQARIWTTGVDFSVKNDTDPQVDVYFLSKDANPCQTEVSRIESGKAKGYFVKNCDFPHIIQIMVTPYFYPILK